MKVHQAVKVAAILIESRHDEVEVAAVPLLIPSEYSIRHEIGDLQQPGIRGGSKVRDVSQVPCAPPPVTIPRDLACKGLKVLPVTGLRGHDQPALWIAIPREPGQHAIESIHDLLEPAVVAVAHDV